MKTPTTIGMLNILIVISITVAASAVAALAMTVVRTAQTISLDQARESSFSFTGTRMGIEIPVTLMNPGPLAISGLSLMLTVMDEGNATILNGYNGPFTVLAGETRRLAFSLSLDLNDTLTEILRRLVTIDKNLSISADFQAHVPPLAQITGSVYSSLPWGAPLSNLQTGSPSFTSHNQTHFLVRIPLSFVNNSPFIDINATLNAKVINATSGLPTGAGRLYAEASKGQGFSGDLDIYMGMPIQSESLFFNDASLNYSVTISTVVIGVSVSVSRSYQIEWGAPAKNLSLGPFLEQAYNATHARVSLPFSLLDNSTFIALRGEVGGKVLDSSGRQVGSIETYVLDVNSGDSLFDQFTGFVELSALEEDSLTLRLLFQTPYGSFTREVQIGA